MVEAVIREAREATGVLIDPEDVTVAVTVHHRPPSVPEAASACSSRSAGGRDSRL